MQIYISRRALVVLLVFAWIFVSIFGLIHQHPFKVATEMATSAGGWSPEQVRFERGSYLFLFVCTFAQARFAVTTDAGEVPAEIRLVRVPFSGWSVREFEVGELPAS